MKAKKFAAVVLALVMLASTLAVAAFAGYGYITSTSSYSRLDGQYLNPYDLTVMVDGVAHKYIEEADSFSFNPSIDYALTAPADGSTVEIEVFYGDTNCGTLYVDVAHNYSTDCQQLESCKEHACVCKYCGKIDEGSYGRCEDYVAVWKPNNDAGLFKLQTETGTCTACGGSVTRAIPESNTFFNIFPINNEGDFDLNETEMTIFSYFQFIVVSMIQMIIPMSSSVIMS